jgi:hypothetical protein
MPSREASLRNLETARAKWRPPKPWRSLQETRVIKRLVWQWFDSNGSEKWSGRAVARKLGVTHTYVQKLLREFRANPDRIRRRQAASGEATFAQLTHAREETRQQKELGRLRNPRLSKVVEFRIGGRVVSVRLPTGPKNMAPEPPVSKTPGWAGGWLALPRGVLMPPSPQLLSYFPRRHPRQHWRATGRPLRP